MYVKWPVEIKLRINDGGGGWNVMMKKKGIFYSISHRPIIDLDACGYVIHICF